MIVIWEVRVLKSNLSINIHPNWFRIHLAISMTDFNENACSHIALFIYSIELTIGAHQILTDAFRALITDKLPWYLTTNFSPETRGSETEEWYLYYTSPHKEKQRQSVHSATGSWKSLKARFQHSGFVALPRGFHRHDRDYGLVNALSTTLVALQTFL
jgi:hypothetical protein